MRKTKPSDYSYKRFLIREGEKPATTVSFSWLEYMALLRLAGNDVRTFSRLVRSTARHLRAAGHTGKLSQAVRKDVRGQLGVTR